ncbi:hypothetical protein TSUD_37940 [Trifolium subterraneum]|uniref:Uncharacterized protein n=1 Tax=Trifolium subterraneum TaxID=3900 RepID=A0A2Z6N7B0_TRISU|nr:hypothetical protein TSUD_37940 [Trifolium subterraneum]
MKLLNPPLTKLLFPSFYQDSSNVSSHLMRLFLVLESYEIQVESSFHHALGQTDIDRSCTKQSTLDQ